MNMFVPFLVGAGLGVFIGWLFTRPAIVRLQTELERERAAGLDRVNAYESAQSTMRESFRALSADALRSAHQDFLALAEGRFRQARSETTADVDARKKGIEELLAPMKQALDSVEREVRESERRRLHDGAQLIERMTSLDSMGKDLRAETRRLVDALKTPGVRGRWGELQLKRVVELAGMVDYCDFDEQPTVSADERRLRPDLIVRLPGGKRIVVDSKVPLDAYLRALDAPDEASRRSLMVDHARQVRTHLTQLAAKGYAAHVNPSPDFVVMFLPGEMFFSAALEQDASLIEYGVDQHVIPASPTTLIALLRAAAYGWQQEAVARDAQQIAENGRKLYDSIGRLAEHFERLGLKLRNAIDAYNDAIGSLEGNVLVKARKFKDAQLSNGEELKPIEPIDRQPRMLQAAEVTGGLPFVDGSVAAEEEEEVERV